MIFRPEDPNDLIQVLPQMDVRSSVTRIKGFRYPAPGSRSDARVPIRESEDHVFSTNYYIRDPANLKTNVRISLYFWFMIVLFIIFVSVLRTNW